MDTSQEFDLRMVRGGGYMIVRLTNRASWMTRDLLPERILSASDHVCSHLPAPWCFIGSNDADVSRRWAAGVFGIAPDRLTDLVLWLSERLEESGSIGWPDVFLTIDSARRFAARFLPATDEWALIGLGIQQSYAEEVGRDIDAKRAGCWAAIDHMLELASGSEILGFELLGYSGAGSSHSWICNGLERTLYDAIGIRPNRAGFLSTPRDAALCLAHIIAHPICAEPVPWFPWLLVQYPC